MTNPEKIIIIEDDIEIGQMLKQMLEYKGFHVMLIQNPDGIAGIINTQNIRLIILDILLSGANGIDICKRLKAGHNRSVPVLMFSALSSVEQECMAAGADDFIAKPFEIQMLFEKVYKLMAPN